MKPLNVEKLPGVEGWFQQPVEAMPVDQRLTGLAPGQTLRAFSPEQRLSGLAPEQVILDVLRVLPEEHLRSLPVEVRERVKQRLRAASH